MLYPEKYDAVWHLRESGFNAGHMPYYESIFTLGNGYLGTRGSLEEILRNSSPATLIAGIYDKAPEHVTELANVANWLGVEISIDGEGISLEKGRLVAHERILDLQSGVLYRKSRFRLNRNREIQIHSRRFVSIADVHLMGIEFDLEVIDAQTPHVKLALRSGFDGTVTNEGRVHFAVTDCGSNDDNELYVCQKALHSDHEVALGCTTSVLHGNDTVAGTLRVDDKSHNITTEFTADIRTNIQYRIEKVVSIYTSRESKDPKTAVRKKIHDSRGASLPGHFGEHKEAWAKRWEYSDVEIKGDDYAQLALRISIFHLLQAASETDERVSIPAKALTGFGYKGHVFWDTEIFMLPYFTITNPVLTRNMLTYRYHTLHEARNKAKQNGYRGAMFAWESADTGEETTPQFVKHLTENKIVRIWCGDIEQHISSDVAFAVWKYFVATRDTEFLLKYGAEIILDTARFWSSRAEFNTREKVYEIRDVIGPDEYHEHVNNNCFTNAMAQWNIRKAIEVYLMLKNEHVSDWDRITRNLALSAEELKEWHSVAENIAINFDQARQVFVQFDGFMDLEVIDLREFADRTQPMDVVLGPERISKSQISKQADVLMMMTLFRENFPREIKEANWYFYEPLCGHGSSLSPATHSLLASDLGFTEEAYKYFIQSAGIDLRDKMGNSGHGFHAATAGGLLQAAIYGFGGVNISEEDVVVNPRLPRHWKSMKFHVLFKGKRISIYINGDSVTRIT